MQSVYVANFRTDARIPVDRIPYAFNTHLPGDIVVTGAMEVHEGFNAIGSCVKKEYTYLIYNSRDQGPVLCQPRVVLPQASGRDASCSCAAQPVCRDARFCRRPLRSARRSSPPCARSIIMRSRARAIIISLRVCANGFLYNMARAMAGTVVYAAEGKFPPEEVANILARGDRKAAGPDGPARRTLYDTALV